MNRLRLLSVVSVGTFLFSCSGSPTSGNSDRSAHQLKADPGKKDPGRSDPVKANSVADRYIVVFKKDVARQGVAGRSVDDIATSMKGKYGGDIVHTYRHALHGMAVKLPAAAVKNLEQDSRVAYVEPDGIVTANDSQTNATWGLDRADQRQLPLNQTYVYPSQSGAGVHAYVIDTGVYAAHSEFALPSGGSRVIPGYDFIDNDADPSDCNGHGTHVAGTIGGATYGLAKQVTFHSVRVLDCGGSGTYSGVIAGIDWVTANRVGPAVANMSLGGGFSQAVNDAVTASIAAGVTYGIAAGNSAANACSYSPASTPNAITVGATNSTDTRASFSNYGTCVDIFAPGETITSAWIGSTTAINTISGTSMATPHVVGAAALWLGLHPTATPAEVAQVLTMRATPNLVQNPGTGSPNVLLYMGNMTGGGTVPEVSYVGTTPSTLEGGGTANGTVLLTDVAPAGGASVALVSSDSAHVTVPATVTVPEGAQGATFSVSTTSTDAQAVVAINATYPAGTTVSASVTLLASPTPASVTLSPTSVQGGTSATATVTLTGPAPAGGAVVTLTSANTAVATVPASLAIPAGSTTGTFLVSTLPQSTSTSVAISAAYHGLTRSATLQVTMTAGISLLTVSPTVLQGGGSATGTVLLNTAAPSGGAVVQLSASDGSVNVPASVTVTAGLTSTSFSISTLAVTSPTTVTITGTYPTGLSKTATLTLQPSPTPASLTLSPSTVPGGTSSTATLTLTGPAPAEGAVVSLSSNSAVATVPSTTTIAAGATSGTFVVSTTAQSSTVVATISATYHGLSASGALTVTRVLPVGNAVYDSALLAPKCGSVGSYCDSGGLIDGRATLGPESNAPNTIASSCADGTAGVYHSDESLDRLKISTVDGSNLAPGKAVKVDATVWAWSGYSSDHLDLYLCTDVSAPSRVWTLLTPTTITPTSAGTVVLTFNFTLPSSGASVWALRGNFRYVGSPATCTTGGYDDTDDLAFVVDGSTPPVNVAPVVNAGDDQTVTLPASATLAGTVTDDGLPNPPATVTVAWSQVSGPGTTVFANPNAASTTASFTAAGTYTLRLTANDSALSASDTVVITVNPTQPVNTAPVVNAGEDQTVTLPASAMLTGTVTDDGLPNPPATVTVAWSQVSGPGTTVFGNANAVSTTASFTAAGTYTLRLTANDSALSASDTVVITVNPTQPVNTAPVVNAGEDQTVTLPASATLTGTVTDDGLPNPPATVTVAWSQVSGPGTTVFGDANAVSTTASFTAAGTYTLRLTANDSALSASDTVVITVNPTQPVNTAPVVNAGNDQTVTLPASATLAGTVTDDGLPNPPATVTVAWSQVSGPGTTVFGNANAVSTTASFTAAGTYTLRLTANDSALSASDTVVITVNPTASSPCAGICSNPTVFTINGSYQSGSLGTAARCLETTSTIYGANCGNFTSSKTLKINGVTKTCNGANWSSVPAKVNGGYCIQVSAGDYAWAYFTAW